MNKYEKLILEHHDLVQVHEIHLNSCNGYYCNGHIFINKSLPIDKKYEVLLEELGHHYKSIGVIDINDIIGRKEEKIARSYAYSKLVSERQLYNYIIKYPYSTIIDVSNYFGIDMFTLDQLLLYYRNKYGNMYEIANGFLSFVPLKFQLKQKRLFEL